MDPGSTEPSGPHRRFVRRAGDTAATIVVEFYDEQARQVAADDLGRLALFALDSVWSRTSGGGASTQVDVTLVDTARMTELNRAHMGASSHTDVLAFPMDAPGEGHEGVPSILGDVVICPDVAAMQARAAGHGVHDELELLLVHGILHLVGHDHVERSEREAMFGLTDEILSAFRSKGTSPGGSPVGERDR